MSERFAPSPGDTVRIFKKPYVVQEHPNAPGLVFCAEGGRAKVYQVKDQRNHVYGLKVFRKKFRDGRIDSHRHLQKLERFKGMAAAARKIVPQTDPAVSKYPDLEFAVLMPWISGRTWAESLLRAGSQGPVYSKQDAVVMCSRFLEVISNLEKENIAHTDISGGNVIFQMGTSATELLDLEDVYVPGAPEPLVKTIGTPNYQHQAGRATWCEAGDRYATAVLASEVLLLSDPMLSRKVTELGYYTASCLAPEARGRFEDAERWFNREAPEFGEIFRHAWWADSLEHCPRVSELSDAIAKTPAGNRVQVFTPSAPAEAPAPSEHWTRAPGADRAAPADGAARPARAGRPARAARVEPATPAAGDKGIVDWVPMSAQPISAEWEQPEVPTAPSWGRRLLKWLLVLGAVIFLTLLFILALLLLLN